MKGFLFAGEKKLGLNPSRAAIQWKEMLQQESKSEEQLGELGLFSLKRRRLRKNWEVMQVSFVLGEGQDSPFWAVLTFPWHLLGHLRLLLCAVWSLRVSHQARGSNGLFWAGLKPSWPFFAGGEGLRPKHEPHPQQWRTGTHGFIIPVLS